MVRVKCFIVNERQLKFEFKKNFNFILFQKLETAKNTSIGVCLRKMYNEFGHDLYVKHRLKGEKTWSKIDSNENEFIAGLESNKVYEFVVTTADDDEFDANIDKSNDEIGMDIIIFYSFNKYSHSNYLILFD